MNRTCVEDTLSRRPDNFPRSCVKSIFNRLLLCFGAVRPLSLKPTAPMKADVIAVTPLSPARSGRIFHTCMAIAFLVTAVAGFGPTYFLKEF